MTSALLSKKWGDKEEVLRKNKMLKSRGVYVEEDMSRAGRNRRRELEKLCKEVKVGLHTALYTCLKLVPQQ